MRASSQKLDTTFTVMPQGGLKTAKPDWAAFIFCGGIGLSFSAKPKKKNGGDAEITVNTR